MKWGQMKTLWQAALNTNTKLGGPSQPLSIDPPATEAEVQAVERELKRELPLGFRDAVLTFSRRVDFSWQLPDNLEPPDELSGIFSGGFIWDLNRLVELARNAAGWIEQVFPDAENEYDRVWHDKLAVIEVPNGDQIAIDLGDPPGEEIVYLSHDDGEGHGYRLGKDFADFMTRWSKLACVGPEDWQWLHFTRGRDGYLDPNCEKARIWAELFPLSE